MLSGAGRGRDWLNLAKNAEPPKPVGLSKPPVANLSSAPPDLGRYKELVQKIKELNGSDDGIAFNKKIRHIQTFWTQECKSQEDVEHSFEELYKACLNDIELASKLVSVVASHTIKSQRIHDCSLRTQFLNHLQKDFNDSNQLQSTNPTMFRILVHMIGEYYKKARLPGGDPYKCLAIPFLSCLDLLLSSKSSPDLILYTTQLFLNGTSLKSTQSEELMKLSIKTRSILATESQLSTEAKLWMLLSLDLFNVRFGVLPPEIYKFYEDQLGSSAIIIFQISTSPTEAAEFPNTTEYTSQQNSSFSKDMPPNKSKEKTGRPILGVGTRCIKKTNDENGKWNNKPYDASGWNHNNKKPPMHKNNKGWKHDDRLENGYN